MHHVFARGNDKRAIFLDDGDRRRYLALLERVVRWNSWKCLTYCLMGNHVHLVIENALPDLGSGMQQLHGRYAQIFNRRHGRSGHLFGGRFGSVRVESDEHLLMVVAYVVRNPVEAGLCRSPRDWVWSSHAAVLRGDGPPWLDRGRLLWHLAGRGGDPVTRYADLTEGYRREP